MIEGYIHSIESMGLVDGPGIRTVVFFQGCRLRCRYCHNPDTWAMRSGKEQIFTPEQLVNKLLRFKPYFGDNGGVTFSGGEPLLQKDFLCEVLLLCKHAGIHTCIDTAGCGCGGYEEILAHTDLVLLDIKHFSLDGYHSITGQSPQEFLQFLSAVQKAGTPLWIRHVVVPDSRIPTPIWKGCARICIRSTTFSGWSCCPTTRWVRTSIMHWGSRIP